jgi:hypothetical protein
MENYDKTLTELGKPPLWLTDKVCVLPFSGRVMGLYPEEGLNVLWTNPAMNSIVEAKRLLSGDVWTNLGGDRTWISPEIELFIKDMAQPMDSYCVPRAVDPGSYSILSQKNNEITLINEMPVEFFRNKCKISLILQKQIKPLYLPDFDLPSGISAAGYELKCTLYSPENASADIRPAVWNLLQVPGGGEIVVPLKNSQPPAPFFGEQVYKQDKGLVSALVPAMREGYKFGIHAGNCCGMMLYLNRKGTKPFLIVRQFDVHNAEEYFDVSFKTPKERGFPQQIYVDDGNFGGFGEMEHHSPAVIPKIRNSVKDISTTWAFSGHTTELDKLLRFLLKNML